MEIFHDASFDDDSIVKKKSAFQPVSDNKDLNSIVEHIEHTDPIKKDYKHNLTPSERKALNELKLLDDVIIKKADKGNTIVIMNKSFYRDKLVLNDHLEQPTYARAREKDDQKVMKNLIEFVQTHSKCLTKKEAKYIIDFKWSPSNFYVLPKIHKNKTIIDRVKNNNNVYLEMDTPPDLKARPIVASTNSPTSRLSEFLEKILSPLVKHLRSYVKDDWDLLKKLPQKFDSECDLYSFDIVSLYTNINHELGIEALSYWFDKLRDLIPRRLSKRFVLEACSFVLKNNNFQFDKTFWHQLVGTAMGTKFAPPYACLAVGYLEETKLYPQLQLTYTPTIYQLILDFFLRYIDDCLTPWPRGPDLNIDEFLNILNSLDENIQFTMEAATVHTDSDNSTCQKLNFLDIMIILWDDGRVETDIYYKETNTHDYLDYRSAHPKHVRDNIPYTLAKKIHVFCSNSVTERERLTELKRHLINGHFPYNVIERGFKNAILQGPANKSTKNITFVTTFTENYEVKHIAKTAQTLLDDCEDERIRKVFNNCSITLATKQPPNLLRQLTRAKFETIETGGPPSGLFKCTHGSCEICSWGFLQECTSFITANDEEWIVQGHITCKSRNIIYYLKCLACKLQTTYAGITTTPLNVRMNNHRSECRSGITDDRFDKHVHKCIKTNNFKNEPYFQVYAFLTVKDASMLRTYESHIHRKGCDTMNRKSNKATSET